MPFIRTRTTVVLACSAEALRYSSYLPSPICTSSSGTNEISHAPVHTILRRTNWLAVKRSVRKRRPRGRDEPLSGYGSQESVRMGRNLIEAMNPQLRGRNDEIEV